METIKKRPSDIDGVMVTRLDPGTAEGAVTVDGREVLGVKTETLFDVGLVGDRSLAPTHVDTDYRAKIVRQRSTRPRGGN